MADDFLTRIQLALDLTPRELAKRLDLPYREVLDRHGPRASMSDIDTDPFWLALSQYVDTRLAGVMAVREELQRLIRVQRAKRAEARRRVREQ